MRLTICLLGLELDITFGPAGDDDPCDGPGSFTSNPVGFTANMLPQWDDQGGYHTVDPGEDE